MNPHHEKAQNPVETNGSSNFGIYQDFGGTIGRTMSSSTPWWPPKPTAPKSAPNVVIMMVDDMGYSDLGCFGSEIPTPNLDTMAANGQRYSNFHVAPLCSPTRAALLTGQNPHAAGVGVVSNVDPGFPGYTAELRDNQPTMAEVFRDNGYSTLMVGKWHLCKDSDLHEAGDKNSWPTQRGFDQYYGFLEGITNLHHPHRLYRDNTVVQTDEYDEDYYLTDDLTQEAERMILEVKTAAPEKPFFMYFSHAAPHAPLHAKATDIKKHEGRYRAGWDEVRRQRFAKQIELGLLPETTELPPPNTEHGTEVEPWDSLTETEKTLFATYMEAYAAMVSSIDESAGRLRRLLEELEEWDNTIFIFLSDNGASREGYNHGTSQYFRRPSQVFNNEITKEDLEHLEAGTIGGPTSWPHYPRGWAMACNTPFRLYKINTYRGGHQVPLVISWPKGISAQNAIIREQFVYVTDIMPTLLESIGLEYPSRRGGLQTPPLAGTSFAQMFNDPDAPSKHTSQYFECNGNRAFYKDGWEIVTARETLSPLASSPDRTDLAPLSEENWALFHVAEDPTQCYDLAQQHPDIVRALQAAWDEAAWKNGVYPLNEGTGLNHLRRPTMDNDEPLRILPKTPTLERYRASRLISGRPFRIEVSLDHDRDDEGILVAHGGQESGYVLYIENGHLNFQQNNFGRMLSAPSVPITSGGHTIDVDVELGAERTWCISIRLNSTVMSYAENHPQLGGMLPFEGIDIGIDRRSPVSWDLYSRRGSFKYSGRIRQVTYHPGPLSDEGREKAIERAIEAGLRLE